MKTMKTTVDPKLRRKKLTLKRTKQMQNPTCPTQVFLLHTPYYPIKLININNNLKYSIKVRTFKVTNIFQTYLFKCKPIKLSDVLFNFCRLIKKVKKMI